MTYVERRLLAEDERQRFFQSRVQPASAIQSSDSGFGRSLVGLLLEWFPGTPLRPNPQFRKSGELCCVPVSVVRRREPELELARNTFKARLFPQDTCWGQDGPQAAVLGLTDVAQKAAIHEFTAYGNQRFSWFWRTGHDYTPDLDNGGTGMLTLQLMLMQRMENASFCRRPGRRPGLRISGSTRPIGLL